VARLGLPRDASGQTWVNEIGGDGPEIGDTGFRGRVVHESGIESESVGVGGRAILSASDVDDDRDSDCGSCSFGCDSCPGSCCARLDCDSYFG